MMPDQAKPVAGDLDAQKCLLKLKLKQRLLDRKIGQCLSLPPRPAKGAATGPNKQTAASCPPPLLPTKPNAPQGRRISATMAESTAATAPEIADAPHRVPSQDQAKSTSTASGSDSNDVSRSPPTTTVTSPPTLPQPQSPEPVDSTLMEALIKESSVPPPKEPAVKPATSTKTQPLVNKTVPTGPSSSKKSAPGKKTATTKNKKRAAPYTIPTRAMDKRNHHIQGKDADLKRLLNTDNDLRLWLEHTRYFDRSHRAKVLDGVKRLRAIDNERSKLLSQVQDDMGLVLNPKAPSSTAQDHAAPGPDERQRSHSTYRREESPSNRDRRRLSRSRSRSPRRCRRSRSPLTYTTTKFDRIIQPTSTPRPPISPDPGPGPIPFGPLLLPRPTPNAFETLPSRLDLGQKGDTRFFLVKSFTEENIRQSQSDGIWVTQVHNGPVFMSAFLECRHVILFFSVNQSGAFQGYARMTAPPSSSIPIPSWASKLPFRTTRPLRVEWLNTKHTSFQYRRLERLKNSLNENASVIVGRDGQEYSDECGRALLHTIDSSMSNSKVRKPLD